MFGFGKKKIPADTGIYAPFSGKVFELSQVEDPVFADKIMGDGLAILPESDIIQSPVAGEITLLQGHAIGFKRFDGLEILLHLGIDTVSLNGAPFSWQVKVGDIVSGGDELGRVDWQQIKNANLPTSTMILITNTSEQLQDLSVTYGQATSGLEIGQALAND